VAHEVSSNLLSQLLTFAADREIDTSDILAANGLSPEAARQPDTPVDAATYLAIQDSVAEASGDPSFGFHVGQTSQPGNYSILGYVMMNCRILGEALLMSEKYHRFMGTLFEWKRQLHLGGFTVLVRPTYPAVSRHCIESAFAGIVTLTRVLTGRRVTPTAVELAEPIPPNHREYQEFFGCPVSFAARRNALSFRMSTALLPVLAPNQALLHHFQRLADRMLESFDPDKPVSREVAARIAERKNMPPPSVRQIASALNMSVRTLQYRLAAEGSDFTSILEEVRGERAIQCLRDGLSVSEAAFYIGFSDAPAFSKYFKRRTGLSPSEYRRRHLWA
jgi:AraC-like DNA-binding protein